MVNFEKDEIRLDLPMKGTSVNDNTWKIVPLMEAVVSLGLDLVCESACQHLLSVGDKERS